MCTQFKDQKIPTEPRYNASFWWLWLHYNFVDLKLLEMSSLCSQRSAVLFSSSSSWQSKSSPFSLHSFSLALLFDSSFQHFDHAHTYNIKPYILLCSHTYTCIYYTFFIPDLIELVLLSLHLTSVFFNQQQSSKT